FNLGIGMIFVVAEKDILAASKVLKKLKEPWYHIGQVAKGDGVVYE
ncbi:MAG: hypothetical protein RL328_682, partial [Acidobacteriota bacterium]